MDDGIGRFQGTLDVTLDLPLASLGSRALAQLVDLLVVALACVLILAVFTLSLPALTDAVRDAVAVALVIAIFLLFWGYFVACELLLQGQSPGKRLLGLRVVGRGGGAVDPLSSMIRNLLRYADFLPGMYGVGVISMLLSPRSQRVGDLAAGTVVVREARRGEVAPRWPEVLGAEDVALLEAWLHRAPHLRPERRLVLARELLDWLRREHPELAAQSPAGLPADEAVRALISRWRDPA